MLTNGQFYADPGGDFYTRRDPERATNRAVHQRQTRGYRVTFDEAS